MELSDIDFKKYYCDPRTSLKEFEKKYYEFQQDIPDKQKVFIYIVLMYDIKSDLRDLYADIGTRKREAAIIAGFEFKHKFSEDVEEMLIGAVEEINDMIVRYIKCFNNPDYVTYVAYWEILYAEIKKAFNAANIESKDLKEMRTNIDTVRKVINDLQVNIFGGEDDRNLRMALYRGMEREQLRLRPEFVAKDLMDKKFEIKDPYAV